MSYVVEEHETDVTVKMAEARTDKNGNHYWLIQTDQGIFSDRSMDHDYQLGGRYNILYRVNGKFKNIRYMGRSE